MNEEWYNASSRGNGDGSKSLVRLAWCLKCLTCLIYPRVCFEKPQLHDYVTWLGRILDGYLPKMESHERALSQFLLDLPYLPPNVFTLLANLCVNRST